MPRRPAQVTQAYINRAIHAAKSAGLDRIELKLGSASIVVPLKDGTQAVVDGFENEKDIVL